jgi:pimeloyl-ACP methyl ester carboxylesterase
MSSRQPRLRPGSALARVRRTTLGALLPNIAARRGVDLFCTPLRAGVPAAQAKDPHPQAQRFVVQVGPHALRTYVWGDTGAKPYVLLAHGWSGQTLQFLAWLHPLLEAGFSIVAFDQQAHGGSSGRTATTSDFVRNLVAVGTQYGSAAAMLGHGLGGAAIALALSQGLRTDCALLLAAQADPEAAVRRFVSRVGLPERTHRAVAEKLQGRTGLPLVDQQAHRVAPALACRALVVHDLQDEEIPWHEGECYARHWPGSRLLTTNGLGHLAILDQPEVIESCIRFIRGGDVGERVVSSPNLPFGLC